MSANAKELGRLARRLIDVSGLPMSELSRMSGVAQPTLSRWRRSLNPPQPDTAIKVARACRQRALELLDAAAQLEAAARVEVDGA